MFPESRYLSFHVSRVHCPEDTLSVYRIDFGELSKMCNYDGCLSWPFLPFTLPAPTCLGSLV